jgi:hypothetical protein
MKAKYCPWSLVNLATVELQPSNVFGRRHAAVQLLNRFTGSPLQMDNGRLLKSMILPLLITRPAHHER